MWTVVGLGLVVRLLIAPHGAHTHDAQILTNWAQVALQVGPINVYAASSANYPPLGVWLIAAMGWLFRLITDELPNASTGLWLVFLKLPAVFADCTLALLVATRAKRPLLFALLVTFNPALLFLSAWWGQLESAWAVCVAYAILEHDRHPLRSGAVLGVGLLIKQQALVIFPLYVLFLLMAVYRKQWRDARWSLVGLILTLMVVLLPFLEQGQLLLLVQRLFALVAAPSWLTVNALNFWYLVTLGQGNWQFNQPLLLPDTTLIANMISLRQIGVLLLGIWTMVVLMNTLHKQRGLLGSVLLYTGAFLLPTQVHERYAFGALVLTTLLAAQHYEPLASKAAQWRILLFFGMITLLHLGNLLWAFPLGPGAGSQAPGLLISAGFILWALWGLQMLVSVNTEETYGRPRPTSN